MKDVFKTQDVFGNNVTCTNSTWYYHIVTNHGIMSKNISAIVDTINDPDYVYEDKDYDFCHDDGNVGHLFMLKDRFVR